MTSAITTSTWSRTMYCRSPIENSSGVRVPLLSSTSSARIVAVCATPAPSRLVERSITPASRVSSDRSSRSIWLWVSVTAASLDTAASLASHAIRARTYASSAARIAVRSPAAVMIDCRYARSKGRKARVRARRATAAGLVSDSSAGAASSASIASVRVRARVASLASVPSTSPANVAMSNTDTLAPCTVVPRRIGASGSDTGVAKHRTK